MTEEQLNYINGVLMGATMMTLLIGAMILYSGGWNKNNYVGLQSNKIHRFFSLTFFLSSLTFIPGIIYFSGISDSLIYINLFDGLSYIDFGFIPLQAFILKQSRIRLYQLFATILPPTVFTALQCTIMKDNREATSIAEGILYMYMMMTYVYSVFMLRKWDKNLYKNYSDVSCKLTTWYRQCTLPLMILPLLWIPLDVLEEHQGIIYTIYFPLSIIIYIKLIQYVLRQDEVLAEIIDIDNTLDCPTMEDASDKDTETTESEEPEWVKRLEKVMIYDMAYLQPDLDCNSLATSIGTNRTYLSRYLNQVKGVTFYDYVNSFRIEESMRLMKMTDLSLDAIAVKCGFKDRVTFYRTFKSRINRSPSEWRKLIKGDPREL